MSHPSRVRGLKHVYPGILVEEEVVAPLAGAWIETLMTSTLILQDQPSHPSRVRGLKPLMGNNTLSASSRTPRGCVD